MTGRDIGTHHDWSEVWESELVYSRHLSYPGAQMEEDCSMWHYTRWHQVAQESYKIHKRHAGYNTGKYSLVSSTFNNFQLILQFLVSILFQPILHLSSMLA